MLNDYLLILTINTLWNQNKKNIVVTFWQILKKKKYANTYFENTLNLCLK